MSQAEVGAVFRTGASGACAPIFDRAHRAVPTPVLVEADPASSRAALAELSDRLLNSAADHISETVEQCLEGLARAVGADRCGVAEFTNDGRSLVWSYGFAQPGVVSVPAVDLSVVFPWYTEEVKRGQSLVLRRPLADDLVPETHEAAFAAALGLESHLMLPLKAGGSVMGALGLDSVQRSRSWSPELVSSLVLLAGAFASTLLRRQSVERLRAAENISDSLRDEVRELRDRLNAETVYLKKTVLRAPGFDEIVGSSAALAKVLQQIEQVAAASSPVLILGETGTGKELVAAAIHERSRQRDRPLIPVNCAALPDALIESELFGYEKGAFTGAVARTLGRFEMANGGSILLDEVGELPLSVQGKLLRVLEGGTFERLGSSRTIKVNVRVIAATNRDLAREVKEGRFRADLYYRLNVFPITIPPLRERVEDVPLLVWHFINEKQGGLRRTIKRVPERLMRALETYPWPGNVRELENVIERALIVTSGPVLVVDAPLLDPAGDDAPPGTRLDEVERAHIEAVLRQCRWKIAGKGNAADRLGLKRGTLQFRMKKLGINRPAEAF